MWGGDSFSIVIISDSESWLNDYLPSLIITWLYQYHHILWVHDSKDALSGDFCFLLGCGQLVSSELIALFKHTLVVHESNLPSGKGWSPLTWQVLEGKNKISVTLLEVVKKVGSGDIYLQKSIRFKGNELIDELRQKQAEATKDLCQRFVDNFPGVVRLSRRQKGKETFYPRRVPQDSQMDLDMSIRKQFNLLRTVDNQKYPAWFEMDGQKYVLKISKKN